MVAEIKQLNAISVENFNPTHTKGNHKPMSTNKTKNVGPSSTGKTYLDLKLLKNTE